jgi:predicted nucleotidyltransferase
MTVLLPEQVDALEVLASVCGARAIEFILIGAVALRVWLPDVRRLTEDLDLAVGLDVDEFDALTAALTECGWRPDRRWEPRWHSPRGARVDLLPAGRRARRARRIEWPRAGTVMRIDGYEHAFRHAVPVDLAPGLRVRVTPLRVLAFLKVFSYLEDAAVRQKDLGDLLLILEHYEEEGDRRFGADLVDTGIPYDEAGAFLFGRDLRALCAGPHDVETVARFLQRVTHEDFVVPRYLLRYRTDSEDADRRDILRRLTAFGRAFNEQG